MQPEPMLPHLPGPQVSGDPQTENWRAFHAQHLERQTRAIEQTRNYVVTWFWLTIAVAALLFLLGMIANA